MPVHLYVLIYMHFFSPFLVRRECGWCCGGLYYTYTSCGARCHFARFQFLTVPFVQHSWGPVPFSVAVYSLSVDVIKHSWMYVTLFEECKFDSKAELFFGNCSVKSYLQGHVNYS